jgi:hypothetical protein
MNYSPLARVLQSSRAKAADDAAERGSLMRKSASYRRPRGDYDVGKGRSPVSTRWKPGQSGNPKGRRKGVKNLVTIFHESFKQKLEIQERGRVRQITALEAIVKKLINEALKGNLKAIEFLLAKEPEITRKAKPMEEITPDMDANEAAKVYLRIVRGVQ